jgi:RNA polymerase sigma factor (sigma-70 family)
MVLGVCRGLVRDLHEADDAFQATFLVLVRKAGTIRRRDTIGPWLHGVASRVARRARDRSDRRLRREVEAKEEIPCSIRAVSESPSVEELIHEEIARLPESFRAPVVLCCIEGLSYDTAARRLGVTEPTLRGRLHRARKQLASQLTRRGITAGAFPLANEPAPLALRAVPPALLESTIHSSVRWTFETGLLSGANLIPVSITGLARGVIKSMPMQSAKLTGVIVLMSAGILGTVVVAQQGRKNLSVRTEPLAALSTPSKEDHAKPKTAQEPAQRPRLTFQQLSERLSKPIDAEFPNGISLEQFLKHIKQQTTDANFSGIPIYVSPWGIREANVSMSTEVAVNMKQKSVFEVLEKALHQVNLISAVRDGWLMIDSINGYRVTIIEQRIQEIDQKLDRVLEALDRLEKAK